MQELQMSKSTLKRMRKKQAMVESSSSFSSTHEAGSTAATVVDATGPLSSGDVATLEEKDQCLETTTTLGQCLDAPNDNEEIVTASNEEPSTADEPLQLEHDDYDVEPEDTAVLQSSTAPTSLSRESSPAPINQSAVPPTLSAPLNGEASSSAPYSSALGPSTTTAFVRPSFPPPALSSSPIQNPFNLQLNNGGSSISTDNLINLLIGKTEPSKPLMPLQLMLDGRMQQTTPAYYGANGLGQYPPVQSQQGQQQQYNNSGLLSSQARYSNAPLGIAEKLSVPPPPGMDLSLPLSGASFPSLAAVPPPGLSPTYFTPKMGNSSSSSAVAAVSKFTFADYRPDTNSSTAELKHPGPDPLSLPVHVSSSKISSLSSLLSQSSVHGPATLGAPINTLDVHNGVKGPLQYQQRPIQTVPSSNQSKGPSSSDASSGNYYKSKGGFSVRL